MASVPSQAVETCPLGVTIDPESGRTDILVWSPPARSVEVVFPDNRPPVPLEKIEDGYWRSSAALPAGTRYKFRLNGKDCYPDPASRFQPEGPHHWSEVIASDSFKWSDAGWQGPTGPAQVVYEMHIGTFTKEGTWAAAQAKLPYLRDLGVTLLEVMPISDFPGRFNWGYDGVQFYAPASVYGRPDEFRSFVNQAHHHGLGVLLDVVYNHLGPDGNYLQEFSPEYFSSKHKTDWGPAINYDGPNSEPVRRFVTENAAYWVREFHLDGLRFDATQDIHDDSSPDILSQLGDAARSAAGNRTVILIGENEPQNVRLLMPSSEGGGGLDALWNDDYHHSATVALTGKADAYYSDYRGSAQEFVSAAKYGFLFQGQWYRWQKNSRGTSTLNLGRSAMVNYIQNHDQVANSARGDRVHQQTSPGNLKAMTALTILMPGIPMLFQGQEFAASNPFLFFADHNPELAEKVLEGRRDFLKQWRSLQLPEMQKCVDNPADPHNFERCKLDFSEVDKHRPIFDLHRDLIQLRRSDPVFSDSGELGIDGAVLSHAAFVLRFFSDHHAEDRLLLVNLGSDLELSPVPEPLLAPPTGRKWSKLWSSDDPQYGGCGTAVIDSEKAWRIPGQAAVVLHPISVSD